MGFPLRNPRRILAGTIVLGLIVVWLARSPETAVTYADVPQNKAQADVHFRSAGSCSAVACHGSIAPLPGGEVLSNEHTTWISDDPHARAYLTLYHDESKDIVTRLAGGKRPDVPAHEDRRCLGCHTTPRTKAELEATPWLNKDGVSCESCHGASKDWLGPHTTTGWKDVDPSVKETKYGMVETRKLTRRAEICTNCHIGRLDREDKALVDVNHDLIAAGHPRLNFEFAAYHDRMPAHWVERGRNAVPDFPAWAWAVGQVVSARAALKLLEGRRATPSAPSPEFSEYNCFSCHHNLADEPWRRNIRPGTALPGVLPWGSWYFPLTEALIGQKLAGGPGEGGQAFAGNREQLFRTMSQPVQDTEKVKVLVKNGIDSLDRELAELSKVVLDGPAVERLINEFNKPGAWNAVTSWDHAAQRYLCLVPLRQAWQRLDKTHRDEQNQLGDRLQKLLETIGFKEDLDSPRGFDPAQVR